MDVVQDHPQCTTEEGQVHEEVREQEPPLGEQEAIDTLTRGFRRP